MGTQFKQSWKKWTEKIITNAKQFSAGAMIESAFFAERRR